MSDLETADEDQLVQLSGDIATAYVTHNALSPADLPVLLDKVHAALLGLRKPADAGPVLPQLVPAVPVRRSVTPDAVICLECGQPFRLIRRHLQTSHGLSPADYRQKWSLPQDYPIVAPNYSARRSAMAKSIGLGSKPGARISRVRDTK
ncbi:MAG: MucR family transcriptional regulator [Gammaproteobacteria bacterium]